LITVTFAVGRGRHVGADVAAALRRGPASGISIDLLPMADGDDEDEQNIVFDRVDDSIVANADAIQALPAYQLNGARWAWIVGEGSDSGQYALLDLE
jgi:hypothetical protein